jgi:uncharacterized protein YuzE
MLDQKRQIAPIDIWNISPKVAKIDKTKTPKKKKKKKK